MKYLVFAVIMATPALVLLGVLRLQRRLGLTPVSRAGHSRSAWSGLQLLGLALLTIGGVIVVNNGEALSNGDAVECDGDPMRPGQVCMDFAGPDNSYDEEKRAEARGALAGYAGVGVGTLGIVPLIGSSGFAMRRRNG